MNRITTEDVQRLKSRLGTKAPKTVNNVLTRLNTLLRVAVEWGALTDMPCTIRLLRVSGQEATFHDFEDFERLVEVAQRVDWRTHLTILLGGEAGLRCGEMMALRWADVDIRKRQLCVQRSDWEEHVTSPKGGRLRYVPLTSRLAAALRKYRHPLGDRVLCHDDGGPLPRRVVQGCVRRAERRALLHGGVHLLRHTFCSHLAMKGAPARAIRELAGHQDLSTTQRYMHLSPAAVESTIRLLEEPISDRIGGEDTSSGEDQRRQVAT